MFPDSRFPIPDSRSPPGRGTGGFRFPIPVPLLGGERVGSDYRLPITDYRLPITDYRLPITDSRFPIPDSLQILPQKIFSDFVAKSLVNRRCNK
ncbi:hypothetical protein BJP36_43055 [Moorena producens JHB]|uniref:Uncharacterized protein n=1 Tax=Moorena producens (strain JHB) TaxID=1454205 RepID=A0A9Q9UVS6_MOOP1|nr:hypothetical protein [Moorena producens]WAN69138.1 hypothetical protein BJP36_43055 [Moorena producens JHB]